MGKSKSRTLAKARNEKYPLQITRIQAVEKVCSELSRDSTSIAAKNLISLFGLSAEELSESGISYEILRSLDGLIK